jgi:hypothetical protein
VEPFSHPNPFPSRSKRKIKLRGSFK